MAFGSFPNNQNEWAETQFHFANTRVQNNKDPFKSDRCQDLNFMNSQTHKFFIFMYRCQIFHEKIIKELKISKKIIR